MSEKPDAMNVDRPIVYVREADRDLLPDEMKSVPGKLFSVHDPSGKVLALTQDRRVAFAMARRNDFQPVSVH